MSLVHHHSATPDHLEYLWGNLSRREEFCQNHSRFNVREIVDLSSDLISTSLKSNMVSTPCSAKGSPLAAFFPPQVFNNFNVLIPAPYFQCTRSGVKTLSFDSFNHWLFLINIVYVDDSLFKSFLNFL